MQKISNEWKANQNQPLTNEGFVEVVLKIADPDAIADASSSDNGASYLSDSSKVVREIEKNADPYLTLEQNMWLLDGSRKTIPKVADNDNGYIGDILSGEKGGFTDKSPTLSITFTKTHRNIIPAITITWGKVYGEFAEDFVVIAYDGDIEVAHKEVTGNKKVTSVVEVDIVNYDRIDIIVLRWCLPCRRARIEEVFVGMSKVYTKSELFGFSSSQTIDPISTSLPKSEVSFSIDNSDNAYNPYNVRGMSKYLMERQEVKTRYGFKFDEGIEWIEGGTYYLSEWDAAQNGITAEFTARDLLEFMFAEHFKGVYNPNGTDLYSLAEALFEEANLPLGSDGNVRWVIDEKLKSIYTVAPLPIDTLANCLQLIANAGGCVLYQDRKGVFHIERLAIPFVLGKTRLGEGQLRKRSDYEVSLENSYRKSDLSLTKPIKQVNVKQYHYFVESEAELYKGDVFVDGTSEVVISYSGSAVNATATVENGVLDNAEYYTNACKLTITANGVVSIVVNGTTLTVANSEVVVSSSESGEVVTVDNPLITDHDRATAVGKWVERYLRSRMILSSSWRADPRLDALDFVRNQNEYHVNNVRMTEVSLTFNGAFHGEGEGRVL
jgi:hypothetical protein